MVSLTWCIRDGVDLVYVSRGVYVVLELKNIYGTHLTSTQKNIVGPTCNILSLLSFFILPFSPFSLFLFLPPSTSLDALRAERSDKQWRRGPGGGLEASGSGPLRAGAAREWKES